MKKIVLTFGFLSGGLSAVMMLATVPFIGQTGMKAGAVVGYTAIVISFLFVYFGIKSYRDNVLGGRIAFGRAFGVGLLITLISCACYVASWMVVYHNFMPDFMDKYMSYTVEQMKTSGATQAVIDQAVKDGDAFREMYKNPLVMVALTLIEPLPVGLLITLISAAVLRRKTPAVG